VQPTQRVMELAETALQRSGLKPAADQREEVVRSLAWVLANTPAKSEHGQLLMRALRPGTGPRPAEEKVIRRLLRRNEQPPYAHVVAQLVEAERRKAERAVWFARIVAKAVAEDGPRAASAVAAHWQKTGAGPTWIQLSKDMGWPLDSKSRPTPHIIWGLARAGWLRTGKEPNSLRPGPRAQEPPQSRAAGDRS
jgi:hypothetical protein